MNATISPINAPYTKIQKNKNANYFEFRNFFKKIKKFIKDKASKIFKPKKKFVKEPEPGEKNKNINFKKPYWIHIIHVISFFIAYLFYYLSLNRCYDGEDVCSTRPIWLVSILITLIISIIISSVLFLMMIYNKVSALNLIHFIVIFIFFYKISHETLSDDHGYYNFVGYFSLLWLIILLGLMGHGIYLVIRSKYRYIFFAFVILLIILIVVIYYINPINCDDWHLGLNNTYLENNKLKYGCQIHLPKTCTYKILSGTQDISKIKKLDCSVGKKDARKVLLETSNSPYINKNTKRFGYPKTNNEEVGGLDGKDKTILLNYTYDNLIDMDNITRELKYWPESMVDFSQNENGEIKVNLSYNETLSKERKKLEGKLNPYSNI